MSDRMQVKLEIDGAWDSEMLRALADVVDVVEKIPPEKRQEAWDKAMLMLERDRKFPAPTLVWNNP